MHRQTKEVAADCPPTNVELPSHIAARQHNPYPDMPELGNKEEPDNAHGPTGYTVHEPGFDLDCAQLKTINPADKDSYGEAKNRVEEDKKHPDVHKKVAHKR